MLYFLLILVFSVSIRTGIIRSWKFVILVDFWEVEFLFYFLSRFLQHYLFYRRTQTDIFCLGKEVESCWLKTSATSGLQVLPRYTHVARFPDRLPTVVRIASRCLVVDEITITTTTMKACRRSWRRRILQRPKEEEVWRALIQKAWNELPRLRENLTPVAMLRPPLNWSKRKRLRNRYVLCM